MKVVISTLDSLFVSVDFLPQSDHEIAYNFQPKKKMTFLASRVLLRLALKSFYALDDVPSLYFGSHGKPYFDPSLSIFFNFSHSGNYIGAAFSNIEMGFDIECVKERKNFQGLCKKVLTEPEKNYIFKLSEKEQREFFTLLWTVRESLLKDSGLGLVGLSSLSFDIEKEIGRAIDNQPLLVNSYFLGALSEDYITPAYFSLTLRKEEKVDFYIYEKGSLQKKVLRPVKSFVINAPNP